MDRETIRAAVKSVDHETLARDGYVDAITDAILAAIGTPDATGDALMRAAEKWPPVLVGPHEGEKWLFMYGDPEKRLTSRGDTPLAALQAALAAVEEAER